MMGKILGIVATMCIMTIRELLLPMICAGSISGVSNYVAA